MIDVHAHLGVPAAARLAEAAPGFVEPRHADPLTAAYQSVIGPEWERKLVDLPARLAFMDARGIDVQLLSVNPGQYYYWADAATAADLVEAVNEAIAAEVARAPGRLLGLGTVALQHPALAAEQLRRAVAHWGAVGVQVSTQAGGRDLDAPELEPLWAAAAECDALVFVHPMGSPQLAGRLASSYLSNVVGQPLETTIALSRLIFSGVLDRHPGLRLCAAHGGGYLPHYLGRGERAYAVRPDSRTMRRAPAEYPRSMWFDSVVHSPGVLGRLIEAVGHERVVIGTDYPFDMGEDDPAAMLAAVTLTPGRQRAIRDRNAVRLLGRHASRLGAGRRPR